MLLITLQMAISLVLVLEYAAFNEARRSLEAQT